MGSKIEVIYDGNLQCTAIHGLSGSKIRTDAPKESGGKDESFSPTDLVSAAAGSCILTVMGGVAMRHGINFQGARAEVVKETTKDSPRRIGKLTVLLTLPAGIPVEKRSVLEKAAQACPVKQSLLAEMEKILVFNYPD